MVVGWNGTNFKPVESVNIARDGWTQTVALEKVIDLNGKWQPAFIYVDEGYGAVQIELLKKCGMAHVGIDPVKARLKDIVRPINFSSSIEVPDPMTHEPVKKPMKPFLVETSVRMFEQQLIEIPREDKTLVNQLENYIIKRRSPTGMPVFTPREEKIGDHRLDALMLALLGFSQNYSPLMSVHHATGVAFTGKFGSGIPAQEAAQLPGAIVVQDTRDFLPPAKRPNTRKRPHDRMAMAKDVMSPQVGYNATGNLPLWSHPGFLRDEPPPRRSSQARRRPQRQNI
jgi:hypothetical protein